MARDKHSIDIGFDGAAANVKSKSGGRCRVVLKKRHVSPAQADAQADTLRKAAEAGVPFTEI